MFTDEEDYTIYTGILNDLQHEGRCELYAYALFPTHVHILLNDNSLPTGEGRGEAVGGLIKRIAASFSYYYNVKYDHYGPIYMDRFKSNPVETKDYFLKVLDHIGSQQSDHKYTCYHIPSALARGDKFSNSQILDSQPPLLDFKPRPLRVTDSKLLAFLRDNYSFTNIGEFLQREADEQKEVIINCKKKGGSIRQIVRLTGCPYQYVFSVRA